MLGMLQMDCSAGTCIVPSRLTSGGSSRDRSFEALCDDGSSKAKLLCGSSGCSCSVPKAAGKRLPSSSSSSSDGPLISMPRCRRQQLGLIGGCC